MMDTEDLLKKIEDVARREIQFLTRYKRTLKSELRIEFNTSQGAVADVKITRQMTERVTN